MNKLGKIKKVKKPWGRETWFAQTDAYMGKLLYVMIDKQVSLHKHETKEETMYLMLGNIEVLTSLDDGITMVHDFNMKRGDSFHVLPNRIHSMRNIGDSIALLLEVSTPHPDDSVRIRDFYGRETEVKNGSA